MCDEMMVRRIAEIDNGEEEREAVEGSYYRSRLEGFGDVQCKEIRVLDDVKMVEKGLSDLVSLIGSKEVDALYKQIGNLNEKCTVLAYDAFKLYVAVKRLKQTVGSYMGGDMLDMMGAEE